MVEIEDFGVDLGRVDVVQRHLSGRAADEGGVGDGGPDATSPDDGYFGFIYGRTLCAPRR